MAWKKWVLGVAWCAAAIGWAALVAFYFTEPSVKAWAVAVTGATILTEIAFWTTAALMGITLWESRKSVFRLLLRPFRRN